MQTWRFSDLGVFKCHKSKDIEENVDKHLAKEVPYPFNAICIGYKEL